MMLHMIVGVPGRSTWTQARSEVDCVHFYYEVMRSQKAFTCGRCAPLRWVHSAVFKPVVGATHFCISRFWLAQVTSIMVSEDTAEDRNLFTPLGSTDAEGNNTV